MSREHAYRHLHKDEKVGRAIQELFNAIREHGRREDNFRGHLVMVLPTYKDGIPVCWIHSKPIAPRDALRLAAGLPHACETDNYRERFNHGKS